jgi:crotonobetainyl-CoA:carnitine CoA-transferase CaiB-like acyl-CoA transferase
MSQALDELGVVELGDSIAAAYAGKLLADAGADVVKVEAPGGDDLRRFGALFGYLNAGKGSAVLDQASPASVADVDRRLSTSAVVIASRDHAHRLGVDLTALRKRRPDLTVVTISPFGSDGPWCDHPATEFTLQAWAGSMHQRGLPGREPLAAGGRTGEWTTGAFAALAALAGWWRSQHRGAGAAVDVSMLETLVITHTVYQPLAESMGQPRHELGRNVEIPSIEPAKDGWVGFCTVQARVWRDFCALVQHQEWADDPSLARWAGRARRVHELRGAIAEWLRDKTVDEVVELAALMRIAVTPLGDGARIPHFDHFVERGVFVANPEGFLQPRPPYRVHGTATYTPRPAPGLGESVGTPPAPRTTGRVEASKGSELPLSGIRIADFTQAWAGSFCAQTLGALGADILKVESTTRPDTARMGGVKPTTEDQWWEWAPIFHGTNTNKRCITIDVNTPAGLVLAKRLIASADVVLENFSPRVMEQFGLDWPVVHALNPAAIMVRMPAFGLDGPWRDRIGFAQTMEQVSGMAWVTGYEGGEPMIPRSLCDPLSGLHAAVGLFVALAERARTGVGRLVESTMVEAALNIAAEQVVEYSATGALLTRHGNRDLRAAPRGAYRCAGDDQWVALAVEHDAHWTALCTALGATDWASDPELADATGRRYHEDRIDAELSAWCASRDAGSVVDALWAAGVPVARVTPPWDVHRNPQLQARQFFETLAHPLIGTHARYPGWPFRPFDAPAPWHRRPAPCSASTTPRCSSACSDLPTTSSLSCGPTASLASALWGSEAGARPGRDHRHRRVGAHRGVEPHDQGDRRTGRRARHRGRRALARRHRRDHVPPDGG